MIPMISSFFTVYGMHRLFFSTPPTQLTGEVSACLFCVLSPFNYSALPDWWPVTAHIIIMQTGRVDMYCHKYLQYIPPPFSFVSLKCLAKHPNIPAWAMGDYNKVMDKQLDTFPSRAGSIPQPGGPLPLLDFLLKLLCEMCGGTRILMYSVTHVTHPTNDYPT